MEVELDSLVPQSHFLKVPSLPFYSLISMLSKFPADPDSRLFWSSASRDLLFGKLMGTIRRIPLVDTDDIDR